MEKKSYYLYKDHKTGEILYLEYDKIKGYPITPKTELMDAISVDKIVFVNPDLSEKLIRKKVDIKLRYFLKVLETIDDDSGDEGVIQDTLMKAEQLKLNILTKYVKYLGNTYSSFTIKKVQIIINQLRIKLYNCVNKREMLSRDLYYLDEDVEEEKKGRGR